MMKERPILFLTPMVKAILEGRKTQTRRIVKPMAGLQKTWLTQESINRVQHGEIINGGWQMYLPYYDLDDKSPLGWIRSPYGNSGDILWVRETWQEVFEFEYNFHTMDGSCVEIREWITNFDSIEKTCVGLSSEWSCASMPERNKYYVYLASDIQFVDEKYKLKWKSPRFMPKAASRIKLEITDIRVERLQDISEEDAIAEGISSYYSTDHYKILWESINGKDSWGKNPWVWVINFKKL